jgi:2,5-diamino-6-(ribosylamino)-4(3H)-pyrimidinone 5'-phosphate reductase
MVTRVSSRRPFVYVNMSMTADGKIASANRRIDSFGSPRDQAHLYYLRSRADAIMVGARTVEAGPVQLDAGSLRHRRWRLQHGLAEQPLRVVVSGSGSVNPGAEIFRNRNSPVLVLVTERITSFRLKRLQRVAAEVKIAGKTEIDFTGVLAWLNRAWQVRRVLVEGGGELNAALFRCGLVDELHLTLCPRILGGREAPTLAHGVGAANLADACRLRLISVRRVGDELFLVYRSGEEG